MPNRVAVIGPIVEPQGMLLRETKTWCLTFAFEQAVVNIAAEVEDVAYL
jgi:hypothetical protein